MIEFSHVCKQYDGKFDALIDVSLFIDKGEFVFLTGQSGAGKTTFLKHIFFGEQPTSGKVTVCGFENLSCPTHYDQRKFNPYLQRTRPKLRRRLGIVFQDLRLLTDRTVYENIAFAARVNGGSERNIKRRVFEVLSVVGLLHKHLNYPEQLSGGEQQRIAIARAIVNEPVILVADEPTGNLDRAISDDIFTLLQEINSWGTTVIMSTHDMSFVQRTHYRQIVLEKGQVKKGGGSRVFFDRASVR